jgi:hypothetical protein
MSSVQLLVWLVVAVGFGVAGWGIGKGKGRPVLGWWLGFLLGLIGIIIVACVPKTRAAKLAEAQRQYQVQSGYGAYPYPPQQPYAPYPPPGQGPYMPYPPPDQGPYAQQPPPPGQWQEPPPPDQWQQQPPPDQWPPPPPTPDPWPGSGR